jgi:hypothetical protein
MNIPRIIVTTAALAVLAAVGCSSTQRTPEVAAAPPVEAAPPAQVAALDAMPSHPALQNERTEEAARTNDAPVVVTYEPVTSTPIAGFTERAPRVDHN